MTVIEFVHARLTEEAGTLGLRYEAERDRRRAEALLVVIEDAWKAHLEIESEWGRGRSQEEMVADGNIPLVYRRLLPIWWDHPDLQAEWF